MSRSPATLIHSFWFGCARSELRAMGKTPSKAQMTLWFGSKPEDDETIRTKFSEHLRATSEHYASSSSEAVVETHRAIGPEQLLADVIALDQFTRVIHRRTANAFANDALAARLARAALRDDVFMADADYAPLERMFLEMPLMHSEELDDHVALLRMRGYADDFIESVDPNGAYDDHALQHFATIKRFGRYPYRNRVLGRADTNAERDYLSASPRTYGQ